MEKKEVWFKAKRYGWGWYPSSWQGWMVIFLWFVLFVFSMKNMDSKWFNNTLFVVIITLILIGISFKKGEKPGWRWGNKK